MKNRREESLEFTSINKIEKSIFEKLAGKKILTLSRLISMGFSFSNELASYHTFANLEDVDKEIINTYVSQGILNLDLLRDLAFSATLEEMKKAGLDSREIKIMLAMGFVVVKEDEELEFYNESEEVLAMEAKFVTRHAIEQLNASYPLLVAKGPKEEQ